MRKKKQTSMDKLVLRFKLIRLMQKLEEKALKIPFKMIKQEVIQIPQQSIIQQTKSNIQKTEEVDRGSVQIKVMRRRFNQNVIDQRSRISISSIDWSVSSQSSIVNAVKKAEESETYQTSLKLLQCQKKKELVTQADINKFMEEVGTYSHQNTSELRDKQQYQSKWQLTTNRLVTMLIIIPIIFSLIMNYNLLRIQN